MKSDFFELELMTGTEILLRYRDLASGRVFDLKAPAFEVEGKEVTAVLRSVDLAREPKLLPNGVVEYAFEGSLAEDPALSLGIILRIAKDSPILRFRYILKSTLPRQLTKEKGTDNLTYLGFSAKDLPLAREIRFSEFQERIHSFCLSEHEISQRQFDNGLSLMGPMMVLGDRTESLLIAYEHGSQVPDAFLHFQLTGDRGLALKAVKGNYYHGRIVDRNRPFETIWFQFAAVHGDEEKLAGHYRSFVLHRLSTNQESRKPYIFYNTWAFQERNKWWNKKTFLSSMNQERILKEIDIAHQMGVEVFVLDTGWYEKTGDWQVNRKRFPDGLKAVKEKLDGYGMKLGLWFNPCAAAVSSRMLKEHGDCITSWHGRKSEASPIWETEESHHMCLVSRYSEAFAEELIRLVKEVGVTYFKWDAIHQYGCDDPGHWHGTEKNSRQERADCYAFEIGRSMIRIVERLCEECPEAIVDFDITEGNRFVGLGFLAVGKYFLINNGPYYHNYDIPCPEDRWINIFVYPGPARAWICREPLSFDKWIPSVLFLTHYLPDDPAGSQLINIASLILGQNGIWGDLLSVSREGVKLFGRILSLYKQVREDITESFPVRMGSVGGSPEIHEKISEKTGRGVIVAFSSAPGCYRYVSKNIVDKGWWGTDGVELKLDEKGRAVLKLDFREAGAKIIFFGVEE